jgi:hypothetical protein
MRTNDCAPRARDGRLAKARQFAEAASAVLTLTDEADEVADAFVTLAVHAGIAAADVICCARLGVHANGERHDDAVALLKRADPAAAKALRVLLGMKTSAGYSAMPVSTTDRRRAERAMDALLATANAV